MCNQNEIYWDTARGYPLLLTKASKETGDTWGIKPVVDLTRR